MKTSRLFLAIIALAIVATVVAFVSCKKETEKALNQKNYTIQQAADIRQMDNPRSYFIDFKKKLTESKSDEAFNLDDAAWHLACLANLEFCKVNVEYDNVQFDTVEMQVNVTDGVVLLSDLNIAHEQMCTEIQQFKKGFCHENQNLYYINMSIGADGNAKVALMTSLNNASKGLEDHTWYFDSFYEAYMACDEYFTYDSTYLWYTTAKRELQRILNLYDHQENYQIGPGGIIMVCYLPTRNHTFDYTNSVDTYGSIYLSNARLFTIQSGVDTPNRVLTTDEMCYCLDSYLGLGYDYIDDNLYFNERPVCWTVDTIVAPPDINRWYTYGHQLYVEYGCPTNGIGPID